MPIYSADQYKKVLNGLTTNPSSNPSPAPTSAPIKNNAPTSLYSPDQFKANLNTLTNPAPLYPSINQNGILEKAKSILKTGATNVIDSVFNFIKNPVDSSVNATLKLIPGVEQSMKAYKEGTQPLDVLKGLNNAVKTKLKSIDPRLETTYDMATFLVPGRFGSSG